MCLGFTKFLQHNFFQSDSGSLWNLEIRKVKLPRSKISDEACLEAYFPCHPKLFTLLLHYFIHICESSFNCWLVSFSIKGMIQNLIQRT